MRLSCPKGPPSDAMPVSFHSVSSNSVQNTFGKLAGIWLCRHAGEGKHSHALGSQGCKKGTQLTRHTRHCEDTGGNAQLSLSNYKLSSFNSCWHTSLCSNCALEAADTRLCYSGPYNWQRSARHATGCLHAVLCKLPQLSSSQLKLASAE